MKHRFFLSPLEYIGWLVYLIMVFTSELLSFKYLNYTLLAIGLLIGITAIIRIAVLMPEYLINKHIINCWGIRFLLVKVLPLFVPLSIKAMQMLGMMK